VRASQRPALIATEPSQTETTLEYRITRSSFKLGPLCCAIAVASSACSDAGQSPASPELRPAVRQTVMPEELTFTSFDVPGATSTTAVDVNSHGDVVGRFIGAGQTHGFLRSADGDFTTIDYPGASFTVASSINSEGDIVGWYALDAVPGPLTERHGYLLRQGEFRPIDPPGSKFTNPLGINSRGEVVGRFCTALPCGRPGSGNYHGFLWQNGDVMTIDVPGSRETNAWKVNLEGRIVGGFRLDGGPNRLFTLWHDDFTAFDLPGGLAVSEDDGGINPEGDIVSFYCDASPCAVVGAGAHGFLLEGGHLTTIDFPGAVGTGALGINALGDIAGVYVDASGKNRGFLLSR